MSEQPGTSSSAPSSSEGDVDVTVDPQAMANGDEGDIDPDLVPASSDPDKMVDGGRLGGVGGQGGAG